LNESARADSGLLARSSVVLRNHIGSVIQNPQEDTLYDFSYLLAKKHKKANLLERIFRNPFR
jgi:hypothetical protein